ncbi:HXXEE domain-containing protein [Paenibacillaceae bacterium WGS1546]|uniref:HXXEE domain-containing protein n=1 Tax=Cohnella sp. WGS1546 TaxID=3366810 RepID=UPI00372D1980
MIAFLDQTISLNTLIWLFMIVFMLHDFEEIIGVEPWMKKHYAATIDRIPSAYRAFFADFLNIKSYQFAVAVLLEFILFIPVTFFAAERGAYFLFTAFNSVLLLHVFTHVGQTILIRKYTIGVATAVLIALPYTLYLFYRLTKEEVVTWGQIFLSVPVGFTIVPIVYFGHRLGKRLFP